MRNYINYNEFKRLFFEILQNPAEKYARPAAAMLLSDIVHANAESEDITFLESASELAGLPGYGSNGQVGGVNVWRDENGKQSVEFVLSDDCTWMTLEQLVEEAINANLFSWYEEEWVRQVEV